MPTAAVGILVALLLDAGLAIVLGAVIAVIAGAVNDSSLEMTAYVFLGGFAGIVGPARGPAQRVRPGGGRRGGGRCLVVTTFTLLGQHDLTGILSCGAPRRPPAERVLPWPRS